MSSGGSSTKVGLTDQNELERAAVDRTGGDQGAVTDLQPGEPEFQLDVAQGDGTSRFETG